MHCSLRWHGHPPAMEQYICIVIQIIDIQHCGNFIVLHTSEDLGNGMQDAVVQQQWLLERLQQSTYSSCMQHKCTLQCHCGTAVHCRHKQLVVANCYLYLYSMATAMYKQ
jgi:hypothetical protein